MNNKLPTDIDLYCSEKGAKTFVVLLPRSSNYKNHYMILHGKNEQYAASLANLLIGSGRWVETLPVPEYHPSAEACQKVAGKKEFVSLRELQKNPVQLLTDTKPALCFQGIEEIYRATYKVNVPWAHLDLTLKRWEEDMEVDLSPVYQRDHVWKDEQRTKYVEYILQNGPYAKELQWNSVGWMHKFSNKIELVDGKQRLEAVRKFLRNELKAFDRYREEFIGPLPNHCDFVFFVNNLETEVEVMKWYLQINTGGAVHTDEEIRKVENLLKTAGKVSKI